MRSVKPIQGEEDRDEQDRIGGSSAIVCLFGAMRASDIHSAHHSALYIV
eukprot:CAMPEP_0203847442 /NCGR_PEP_ID=MMETSP0359-20131031/5014_1 /ASSEMBLY_ACC=CAM_ASM_000338 /TAXON_ID=268821 /ORGANISM="Scrippsiella Hangoei, Strain SHTV-5" /LENGTH=48 /DNA_ID= /DNA_START= /DNA_END= /DNA_ORIENTATION=